MKSNKQKIFINTIVVTSDTIISKFIFLAINVLVARYLSVENFGFYATSLAYATFFSTFCDIGINSTIVRFINKEKEKEAFHIANAIMLKTILAILVYAILVVSLFFTNYSKDLIYLTLIFGVVRIGNEYMKAFFAVFTANDKFLYSAILNILFSVLFLSATALIIVFNGDYLQIAYSRMFIVILFVVSFIIYLFHRYSMKVNFSSMRRFLVQASYFGFSSIVQNSYHRLNTIIISFFWGPIIAGYFSNAYLFFTSIFFIPSNLSRVLITHLYKESITDNREKFQFAFDIYSKILMILSFFLALLIFLYAREIIVFFYGEKYLPSTKSLQILSIAIPALFNVSGNIITAMDHQNMRARFQLIALVINVIFNLILVKVWGMNGAAIATVVTHFSLNLQYNFYLGRKRYINYVKSSKIMLLLLVISSASFFVNYLLVDKFNKAIEVMLVFITYFLGVFIFVINKKDYKIFSDIFPFLRKIRFYRRLYEKN